MFNDLNEKIINCCLCPRLTEYIKSVGLTKTKRFETERYWSKPIPSFGDPKASILIIGLAPAAHGGNRTGRIFTGDSSGDWLAKALFETGFANIPTSVSINDNYKLKDVFVTSVIKCAPPQNMPSKSEILNCSQFLKKELDLLNYTVKIIITLGKIAFDNYCKINNIKKIKFGHNKIYPINNGKTLISSYHPSRRNTSTGILTWQMWIEIFVIAKSLINTQENSN